MPSVWVVSNGAVGSNLVAVAMVGLAAGEGLLVLVTSFCACNLPVAFGMFGVGW
jgi:hypothetical protein